MAEIHQISGNAVCIWEDNSPLMWTMSERTEDVRRYFVLMYCFDLTKLTNVCAHGFLLDLKDLLIGRRKRVALVTVHGDYMRLLSLLLKVGNAGCMVSPITNIDEAFLLALRTIINDVPIGSLQTLKKLFSANRHSPVFCQSLLAQDFPGKRNNKGPLGDLHARILTQALSRAACVEVLRVVEESYEAGKIDIGLYSFINLCFHVYVRPQSYRSLILTDLQIDMDPVSGVRKFFLWILPAKTGVKNPVKYSVSLHRLVGELLELQRIHVVKTYGHLAEKETIGMLPMFPARLLKKDGSWMSSYARSNHGAISPLSGAFLAAYLRPVIRLIGSFRFNFNGLRHTVGTQLAEAGCSASTIKAVLKHSHDRTCQAYVDICFHGLVSKLSKSMRDGFDRHYPVHEFRSKHDPVAPQKAIRSEDLETGRIDLTGECGREVACQFAPICCYACSRFVPCFDADHTINLDIVNREIERCEMRGLPFKAMLERSKDARRYIMLVVAASEQRRQAKLLEAST